MFVSFDGIDGAGKTTQIQLFAGWLAERGLIVTVFRDPGGTELSERIREILLSKSNFPVSIRAEMLLYMAARAQLVEERIQPAIAAGKIVIADRYVLATLAYQGHAGGAPLAEIRAVAAVATQGCHPDRTFLLDLDPRNASGRRSREPDRIEIRGEEYLLQVRQAYLAEAKLDPRIAVIDATRTVSEVQQSIREIAESDLRAAKGTPP